MIRLFGLRDTFLVRQLQSHGVAFDLRRLLLYAPSPVRSALAGYFTYHHLGAITCIRQDARNGERADGFVQVWPRAARAEWDLAFLSPALDHHPSAADIWHELLAHLTVLGAEQGILRIYARSAEDAEAEDALRQGGFTLITREEIFVRSKPQAPTLAPRGLRRVTPRDRWALDEFYRQVVPQLVQQAEGDSPHWGAARVRTLAGPVSATEQVWVENDKIIGYLGLCSGARGHWLEIVVHPDHRADVLPHIEYMLTLAGQSAQMPVYCPVPDYAVGLGWLLRTLGFEAYTRQVLMVMHTVARAIVRHRVIVTGLEHGTKISTPVSRSCPPVSKT